MYRQRLKKVVPPCVPFLGLYLTDLTFINDGNPDTRGAQGLINFDKYYKTSRIICEVQRFQHPYSLLDVVELQGWLQAQLESPLRKGIEELHRQSLLLEPRDSSSGLGGFLLSAVGGAGGGGGGSSTSSVGGGNSSRTSVSSTSSNSRRGSEHRSQYQSSSASHNNTNNDDTNSATALSDIEGKLKMLEKVGFI